MASGPVIERVQTGIRIERRLLKVLKALAEYKDMSVGELMEGIVLHAFEGKAPFSTATLAVIRDLRNVYGLTLDAASSHSLVEQDETGLDEGSDRKETGHAESGA